MKLSDKLAALEEEERSTAARRPAGGSPMGADSRRRARSEATARAKGSPTASWHASKRKVRELVLAEVGPKVSGLDGDGIAQEVRTALDKIIQREDVKVSPRERRAFLEEVIQDTLGYGPLDPMLKDNSITEIMCNNFDDIWVERDGKLHHTGASFSDDQGYRHVIE